MIGLARQTVRCSKLPEICSSLGGLCSRVPAKSLISLQQGSDAAISAQSCANFRKVLDLQGVGMPQPRCSKLPPLRGAALPAAVRAPTGIWGRSIQTNASLAIVHAALSMESKG